MQRLAAPSRYHARRGRTQRSSGRPNAASATEGSFKQERTQRPATVAPRARTVQRAERPRCRASKAATRSRSTSLVPQNAHRRIQGTTHRLAAPDRLNAKKARTHRAPGSLNALCAQQARTKIRSVVQRARRAQRAITVPKVQRRSYRATQGRFRTAPVCGAHLNARIAPRAQPVVPARRHQRLAFRAHTQRMQHLRSVTSAPWESSNRALGRLRATCATGVTFVWRAPLHRSRAEVERTPIRRCWSTGGS